MFKRISCIAFGVAAASLISAVEPAQAFSIRSNNSSYTNSSTTNSFTTLNSPSTSSYSQFSPTSSNLLAQGTTVGSMGDNWLYAIPLALLIWMIAEGLDTTGGDGDPSVVLGRTLVKPPVITPGDNDDDGRTDNPVTPIPSPALLPGLIGMGTAAIRKRRQITTDQA